MSAVLEDMLVMHYQPAGEDLGKTPCFSLLSRGVTIHKSHHSVRTLVFKPRFGLFFSTAGFII